LFQFIATLLLNSRLSAFSSLSYYPTHDGFSSSRWLLSSC
jgi:hypothetical protein